MAYYIVSFVVIILLVLAMSLILKNAVKTIDKKSKSYFVDKLKEYDYLIDEKEKKLTELDRTINERKKGLKEENKDLIKRGYDFDSSIIDLLTETNYLDKNVFAINRKIDEKFVINYEELIKDFLSNIKEDGMYEFCINLRNKFTSDEIYKIEIMLDSERESYFKEFLSKTEYEVYNLFIKDNKFKMEDFIDYLNKLIELNDPTVTVLTSSKNVNFDYIDKRVKTKVSNNIYKGIKIIYKNKVYDFSLNEGNV